MKSLISFCCILFWWEFAGSQIKIPVEEYVNLLNQGKYDIVYKGVSTFRRHTSYGKCAVLDYFEAKCLCLNGTCDDAYPIFANIFQGYHLSPVDKDFLIKEMQGCNGGQSSASGISVKVVVVPVQIPVSLASVHGKLGLVTDCYDANQFLDFPEIMSQDEMERRVFDKGHKKEALSQWRALLSNNYFIDTSSGRFIIITPGQSNPSAVKNAIASLQKAAEFYSRFYHLSPPEKLITVFMLPNIGEMKKTARQIHHIELPSSNLGYSNLGDLSLLGISDITNVGTIYHELFHLMIRSDIGNIPVWLDEGLASLYSTYTWKDNTLLGGPTWRTNVLRMAQHSRDWAFAIPSIKLLTSYSWDEFNGIDDHNICRASVNYALANHLMLYFQEKNLLQRLVDAYHYGSADAASRDSIQQVGNSQILEKVAGEPLDSLDKHFSTWMVAQYGLHTDYNALKSAVPTFDEIFRRCEESGIMLYENPKNRDSIFSFRSQVEAIRTAYYKLDPHAGDFRNFYRAKEKIGHGVFDPYILTKEFKKIDSLYVMSLDIHVKIRKAIFNKN